MVRRASVYSLGAILYHMLAGRPPFQSDSALDTILLVLEQDPVPPRVLNPRANADLEMIALKCLQKPPEFRYPTAAALADDLDAVVAGEPVSARSTSLRALAARLLGETHHAAIMENWGFLWVCHSVAAAVVFFGLTNELLSLAECHRPLAVRADFHGRAGRSGRPSSGGCGGVEGPSPSLSSRQLA